MMEDLGYQLSVVDIIEALDLLLTPSSSGQKCIDPGRDPFKQHLQQNLETLDKKFCEGQFLSLSAAFRERIVRTDVPDTSTEWQYVNYILQLLYLLSQVLVQQKETSSSSTAAEVVCSKPKRPQDAPPLTKAILSLSRLSIVKNALQFVASLGICPNLAPGVGIPLQHRSQLITLAPLESAAVADISKAAESNSTRLSVCMFVLAEMLKVEELQSVILNTHLNDILAALLQLLYGFPIVGNTILKQKESPSEQTKQETTTAGQRERRIPSHQLPDAESQVVSSGDAVDSSSSEKRNDEVKEPWARDLTNCAADNGEILRYILANVSPVVLIRELMVLQVGVPRQIQSARNPGAAVMAPPGWLKKSCSRLLFQLTNGPQGIQHLYQAISAGTDLGSPVAWKHCGTVAKIIGGYPVQTRFLDQYIANIAKQLMDLVHADGNEAKRVTQLLGAVACVMTVKHKETFFRHFHGPLLQPLLCCLESPGKKVDGTVALSEEDLTECLQNLHQVYIRGQPPLSDILCALHPVITVLWALYCVTHSAVYSIKQWVKDLLVSYLKFLGGTEAAACLRQLCLGQGPSEVSVVVHFKAGGQGALQAVYGDAHSDPNVGENQQVAAAVVCILHDLKKETVVAELLVTLLKEMTEMISQETQQPDVVLPPSVLGSEVRQQKKGELMRRVTVLHLLASICETFGSECLSDNLHILLFIKASLERGVAVCGGTRDEEMAIFETETMSMAMGLLTAVMAGAIQMKEEDRVLMDSMSSLLEVIAQGHADEFIREMASDIHIAIETRGAVWSSLQASNKQGNESKREKTGNTSLLQPGEKAAADSNKRNSSHLFTKASLGEEPERPIPTRPPSKPLIEVLSDHPSPDYEAGTQGRSSSPAVPGSVAVREHRSASKVSSLKDGNILSSSQTLSSSSVTDSTVEDSASSSDQTARVCEVSASRTDSTVEDSASRSDQTARVCEVSASRTDSTVEDSASRSDQTARVCEVGVQQDSVVKPALGGGEERVHQGSVVKPPLGGGEKRGTGGRSELQTAFEELCDPLLPVRGHALLSLARLVQRRDPETLAKRDVLHTVFEENLRHGDSYLYLAAINGMSALADCFPETVLPSLAQQLAGFCRPQSGLTTQHRLKVGEALMKATRNLGEMIPKYRELLLGAVLTGARDRDATVRASSVSNLAEVSSLLRFSLGPVLQEVLHCCSSLLETDEVMVRQAAALTLAKLLEGLGSDCFSVLESALPTLYRLLKKVCAVDEDEVVRVHANLALDHLDSRARDYAFPRQTLQKKIQVLPNADTFR